MPFCFLPGVATEQMGYKNFVLGSCPRIRAICIYQILCRCFCVGKVGAGNGCIARFPTFCIFEGRGGEVGATRERRTANIGDTTTNGHRGEAGATRERIVTNVLDTIRNGHRGEVGAT